MALNTSDIDGHLPGHGGPRGLFPLFWRLQGENCGVSYINDVDGDAVSKWRSRKGGAPLLEEKWGDKMVRAPEGAKWAVDVPYNTC